MNLFILFQTSLTALIKHKGRSFLTMLGIIVGIAAIIVTFSIGSGAEKRVTEQIMSMGDNAIFIIPGNVIERGGGVRPGDKLIKEKDLRAIVAQSSSVRSLSRGNESIQTMEYRIQSVSDRVHGVDALFLPLIAKKKLKWGVAFNDNDVFLKRQVVVLGETLAQKLFGKLNPVGLNMRIAKRPYTIIGVLAHVEVFFGTNDPNNYAYIPYSVAKKYFAKPEESKQDVGFIALSQYSNKVSDQSSRIIKRILRASRSVKNEQDDFTMFDQQSIATSATAAAGVIKLFGLIAASISLFVGGIGVMNIMLVSIKERTREIGVRLAIGATPGLIQLQFLIESIVLTFCGGLLGIACGVLMQKLLSSLTNLPGTISWQALGISCLITLFVGLFFGYYPARVGSLLNPVDALLDRK